MTSDERRQRTCSNEELRARRNLGELIFEVCAPSRTGNMALP